MRNEKQNMIGHTYSPLSVRNWLMMTIELVPARFFVFCLKKKKDIIKGKIVYNSILLLQFKEIPDQKQLIITTQIGKFQTQYVRFSSKSYIADQWDQL